MKVMDDMVVGQVAPKAWRPLWARVAVVTLGLAGASAAWAQAVIQSVIARQQGSTEVIRVEFDRPLAAVPQSFAVQTPPRIAIDLPGASTAMAASNVEFGEGNARSAAIAQGGDRVRMVLNLRQSTGYRLQLDGKALVVVLDAPVTARSADAVASAGPGAPAAVSPAVRDIDFRRGEDGAGRIIVGLPAPDVAIDTRVQGQRLIVDIPRVSLPEALRRRLDVTDFGTPVQAISSTQEGSRVRLVIEPRGTWEHSAYQTDNQFVIEVRPARVDANKLIPGVGYSGEKLSLNFQNIEVRALLQVIADFTNFNIVTSDAVTGSLTLRLKDVPWDQALDIILQARGLGVRKNGNVLRVAPKTELAAEEQAELEALKKVRDLEPVRTQAFQLNYTKAQEVANGLRGGQIIGAGTGAQAGAPAAGGLPSLGGGGGAGGAAISRILSPRGSALPDVRTNQLFVTDIPSKLEEIQALIAKIDVPVRQVMIEARIVEATDTFGKSLGVRLGANDVRAQQGGLPGVSLGGSNRLLIGGNVNAVGAQTLQPGAAATFANTQFVNLPAGQVNNNDPASIALSIFSAASNRFLNLELSALESDGKGKIISSPRIVTADKVEAFISQGAKIPFQRATTSGATAVEFVEAALKLKVTPQITPEGNVILDVNVNKDSLGALTPLGREINVKEAKTQVLVENGGTVVIGGIFEQNELSALNKVPLLGDVPVVGSLFRNQNKESVRTELLIFLTPRVVSERQGGR